MRFGLQVLSLSTILFSAYGIALNDAHPQSARDNKTTPLILEKAKASIAFENPERFPYRPARSRLRSIAKMAVREKCG